MSKSDVIVQAQNISKTYTSGVLFRSFTDAVKNVSFELKRKKITALVGESGSGKTTIANLLLRLIPLTVGTLYLNGKSIYDYPKKDYYKQVQVVFQDPYSAINYFYKIDRVLLMALDQYGEQESQPEERDEVINSILNDVGLNADEVRGRFPHQLSGGQLQRFLIARVLLIQPSLLIADEPTSMIDASSRAGILNILRDLRDDYELTILFITHDIGQAQYVSDDILVMKDGEIVEQGSSDQVLLDPQHSYTQFLLSCVPSLKKQWIIE
ncbi:MAG: ABC transporter ATP-binding protein [Promethearchaeota archaeon]